MNMKSDNIWFNDFYNTIQSQSFSASELINLLGNVERTNVYNEIKNIFLIPIDNRFSSICITENITTSAISSIIFIGSHLEIPYNEIMKYSISVKKHLVIYDDNVEYVFSLNKKKQILKTIVCKAEEAMLDLTIEEDKKLKFNNIIFHF